MLRRRATCGVALLAAALKRVDQVRLATDAKTVRSPHPYEQFAYKDNMHYLESLLESYRLDKSRVDPSWWPLLRQFEQQEIVEGGVSAEELVPTGPSTEPPSELPDPDKPMIVHFERPVEIETNQLNERERQNGMRLAWMIRRYEQMGHLAAKLDPLHRRQGNLVGWSARLAQERERHEREAGMFSSSKSPASRLRLVSIDGSAEDANGKTPALVEIPVSDEPLKVTEETALDILQLSPSSYGLTESDLNDTVFYIKLGASFGAMVTSGSTPMRLKDIISNLKGIYCSEIGFEFMHAGFYEVRDWFRQQIVSTQEKLPAYVRRQCLRNVMNAVGFEQFLHVKYATQKRFGLDGGESAIAGLKACINILAEGGMEHCVLGMAHRGRLSVLANVCNKNLETMLNEFEGRTPVDDVKEWLTGDVKYHMGLRNTVETDSGRKIDIHMLCNPSHLETVNGLVAGCARSRQMQYDDKTQDLVVPIMIHGDAAYAGQGINYELCGLADHHTYSVGGVIHIVINNQIGFTTDPISGRSSVYASDVAKVSHAPIIHVNGDNVDEVVRACRIAARFRQTFHRDVVIDVICYRRFGHNETDLPNLTQPLAYKEIVKHRPVDEIYTETLIRDGVVTREQADGFKKWHSDMMKSAFERALKDDAYVKVKSASQYAKFGMDPYRVKDVEDTGVPEGMLLRIGEKLSTIPSYLRLHPKAESAIRLRQEQMRNRRGIDWYMAEALALGSMSAEGFHIRLTGPVAERGIYSERHAVWTDISTDKSFIPLANIESDQGLVTIANSPLSDYGTLAFETGFAQDNYKSLVIWEAQYGDFVAGAQIVIDQYISSQEAKWGTSSALCLALPHGLDGNGPEHSTARIERYLQMSCEPHTVPSNFSPEFQKASQELSELMESRVKRYNVQVCLPSNPASYFHMLRRQVHRSFRKPLVYAFSKVGTSASYPTALSELGPGTSFQPVLSHTLSDGTHTEKTAVRRVLICTGQIGNKLLNYADHVRRAGTSPQASINDTVIVQLEQLAPFPWESIAHELIPLIEAHKGHVSGEQSAKNALEICWVQEESQNGGAWGYVRPRLNALIRRLVSDYANTGKNNLKDGEAASFNISYIGRNSTPSVAAGLKSVHQQEEGLIIEKAFASERS